RHATSELRAALRVSRKKSKRRLDDSDIVAPEERNQLEKLVVSPAIVVLQDDGCVPADEARIDTARGVWQWRKRPLGSVFHPLALRILDVAFAALRDDLTVIQVVRDLKQMVVGPSESKAPRKHGDGFARWERRVEAEGTERKQRATPVIHDQESVGRE